MTDSAIVDALFADHQVAVDAARRSLTRIVADAAGAIAGAINDGGKILICGNGGSAADGLHFAAELLNKFQRVRKPLAAVCLNADVSTLTSIANDESFDAVFAKQVEALARRGDVLCVITTSGESKNILNAVRAAHEKNITCIALNGKSGGALSAALGDGDFDLIAPGDSTARVQEIHAILIHAFCELVDHKLFGDIK